MAYQQRRSSGGGESGDLGLLGILDCKRQLLVDNSFEFSASSSNDTINVGSSTDDQQEPSRSLAHQLALDTSNDSPPIGMTISGEDDPRGRHAVPLRDGELSPVPSFDAVLAELMDYDVINVCSTKGDDDDKINNDDPNDENINTKSSDEQDADGKMYPSTPLKANRAESETSPALLFRNADLCNSDLMCVIDMTDPDVQCPDNKNDRDISSRKNAISTPAPRICGAISNGSPALSFGNAELCNNSDLICGMDITDSAFVLPSPAESDDESIAAAVVKYKPVVRSAERKEMLSQQERLREMVEIMMKKGENFMRQGNHMKAQAGVIRESRERERENEVSTLSSMKSLFHAQNAELVAANAANKQLRAHRDHFRQEFDTASRETNILRTKITQLQEENRLLKLKLDAKTASESARNVTEVPNKPPPRLPSPQETHQCPYTSDSPLLHQLESPTVVAKLLAFTSPVGGFRGSIQSLDTPQSSSMPDAVTRVSPRPITARASPSVDEPAKTMDVEELMQTSTGSRVSGNIAPTGGIETAPVGVSSEVVVDVGSPRPATPKLVDRLSRVSPAATTSASSSVAAAALEAALISSSPPVANTSGSAQVRSRSTTDNKAFPFPTTSKLKTARAVGSTKRTGLTAATARVPTTAGTRNIATKPTSVVTAARPGSRAKSLDQVNEKIENNAVENKKVGKPRAKAKMGQTSIHPKNSPSAAAATTATTLNTATTAAGKHDAQNPTVVACRRSLGHLDANARQGLRSSAGAAVRRSDAGGNGNGDKGRKNSDDGVRWGVNSHGKSNGGVRTERMDGRGAPVASTRVAQQGGVFTPVRRTAKGHVDNGVASRTVVKEATSRQGVQKTDRLAAARAGAVDSDQGVRGPGNPRRGAAVLQSAVAKDSVAARVSSRRRATRGAGVTDAQRRTSFLRF